MATAQAAGLTWGQVENYWIQAGGNPRAAAMAAAVADASSGLNPTVTRTNPDGTTSIGLWLIQKNGMPPGTSDPLSNARAAVQLSNNGTDWSSWCTTWSDNNCGCDGGSYLGDGANVLGALNGQSGSYTVTGAQPSGDGTSASTTSTPATTTPLTSSSSKWIYLIGIIAVIALAYFIIRGQTQPGESGQSQARSRHSWSPEEESGLRDMSISDKELSAQTGRSIRAIRVRRNQLKSR